MGETQNLKQMIRDSLLLLCRQGVECDRKFAIHAVIGVTVDEEHSFYLHIDENIDSPDAEGPSGARRSRRSTRKRSNRKSSELNAEGVSSPKKILLSEWVSKQGEADESQPLHWSVVKVKPEQQDEDSDTVMDDGSGKSSLTYTAASKDIVPQSVIQNKLHQITCVPLSPSSSKKRPRTKPTPNPPVELSPLPKPYAQMTPDEIRARKNEQSRVYRQRRKLDKERYEAKKKRDKEYQRQKRLKGKSRGTSEGPDEDHPVSGEDSLGLEAEKNQPESPASLSPEQESGQRESQPQFEGGLQEVADSSAAPQSGGEEA